MKRSSCAGDLIENKFSTIHVTSHDAIGRCVRKQCIKTGPSLAAAEKRVKRTCKVTGPKMGPQLIASPLIASQRFASQLKQHSADEKQSSQKQSSGDWR